MCNAFAYDHTTVSIRPPVQTFKSSTVGPGKYLVGRRLETPGVVFVLLQFERSAEKNEMAAIFSIDITKLKKPFLQNYKRNYTRAD